MVAPDRLAEEALALAREVYDKPSVPVVLTKEHVNAVTRTMGAGQTAFADGDVLLANLSEPESRDAGAKYRKKTLERER